MIHNAGTTKPHKSHRILGERLGSQWDVAWRRLCCRLHRFKEWGFGTGINTLALAWTHPQWRAIPVHCKRPGKMLLCFLKLGQSSLRRTESTQLCVQTNWAQKRTKRSKDPKEENKWHSLTQHRPFCSRRISQIWTCWERSLYFLILRDNKTWNLLFIFCSNFCKVCAISTVFCVKIFHCKLSFCHLFLAFSWIGKIQYTIKVYNGLEIQGSSLMELYSVSALVQQA